ncbi:hypothetical protein NE237_002327 [Protea cynaroides]|uniref:Uncharacterized protein n=1 Tax=Protea cynaroides TaxID=273540 RepID=A0A9Q0KVN9_9MAGN|nr:hypothetical protein NE237_002327 [Protea cynaroides]
MGPKIIIDRRTWPLRRPESIDPPVRPREAGDPEDVLELAERDAGVASSPDVMVKIALAQLAPNGWANITAFIVFFITLREIPIMKIFWDLFSLTPMKWKSPFTKWVTLPLDERCSLGARISLDVATGCPELMELAGAKWRSLEEMLDDMDMEVEETFVEIVHPSRKKSFHSQMGPLVTGTDPTKQKGVGALEPKVFHTAPSSMKEVSTTTIGIPLVDKGKGLAGEPSPTKLVPDWAVTVAD